MNNIYAFTKQYDSIINTIITECGICVAYNPKIQINVTHPPINNYIAIWDTGATNSVISQKVINELSLKSIGKTRVSTVGGNGIADRFSVNILLPNQVIFSTLQVTQGIITGADVLIGMDIISQGDFSISRKDNKTLFSFQYPSTHSHDYQTELKNVLEAQKMSKIGRNELCPCGSGNKFKKCHGK